MKFKKVPKDEENDCLPSQGITDEEFASFCKTPEALKRLPVGVITDPIGQELWIDGAGLSPDNPGWTREAYQKRFGFDPKPVWDRMKRQKIVKVGGRHD